MSRSTISGSSSSSGSSESKSIKIPGELCSEDKSALLLSCHSLMDGLHESAMCPICKDVFTNPIVGIFLGTHSDATPHTFDKECLETAYKGDTRCPLTRKPLAPPSAWPPVKDALLLNIAALKNTLKLLEKKPAPPQTPSETIHCALEMMIHDVVPNPQLKQDILDLIEKNKKNKTQGHADSMSLHGSLLWLMLDPEKQEMDRAAFISGYIRFFTLLKTEIHRKKWAPYWFELSEKHLGMLFDLWTANSEARKMDKACFVTASYCLLRHDKEHSWNLAETIEWLHKSLLQDDEKGIPNKYKKNFRPMMTRTQAMAFVDTAESKEVPFPFVIRFCGPDTDTGLWGTLELALSAKEMYFLPREPDEAPSRDILITTEDEEGKRYFIDRRGNRLSSLTPVLDRDLPEFEAEYKEPKRREEEKKSAPTTATPFSPPVSSGVSASGSSVSSSRIPTSSSSGSSTTPSSISTTPVSTLHEGKEEKKEEKSTPTSTPSAAPSSYPSGIVSSDRVSIAIGHFSSRRRRFRVRRSERKGESASGSSTSSADVSTSSSSGSSVTTHGMMASTTTPLPTTPSPENTSTGARAVHIEDERTHNKCTIM